MVDVCGTVNKFSYIRNIDVSFVPEASNFDDVVGCVTSISVS